MIAEGAADEDPDSEEEHVGSYAVDVYVELLEKPNLPGCYATGLALCCYYLFLVQ